jgi:hypothetical protein
MSTPWHGCRYAQETPAGSEKPQARAAGAATGAGTAPASGADHTDTEPQITWRRQAYQQTCHHDRRFHRAPATGFQWIDNTERHRGPTIGQATSPQWHFIRVESGRVTPLARPVNLPEPETAPFLSRVWGHVLPTGGPYESPNPGAELPEQTRVRNPQGPGPTRFRGLAYADRREERPVGKVGGDTAFALGASVSGVPI